MAMPAPGIWSFVLSFPSQKNVYPPPSSFIEQSSASRVSLRAANVLAISAVLSGLEVSVLASSVLTFHDPMMNFCRCFFLVGCVMSPPAAIIWLDFWGKVFRLGLISSPLSSVKVGSAILKRLHSPPGCCRSFPLP